MAIKIYIDQGHNPVNPNAGAEGNGYREQDIVYEIGVRLSDILRRNGFETRLSRPTKSTQLGTSTASSLAARVDDANSWGADYFISLHTNSSVSPQANGSEAFVFGLSSPAYPLALSILEQLSLATGIRSRGVSARPSLYVLRKTRMPALLTEIGFISNPEEASLMANSPGLFASGIANGIIDYVNSTADAFSYSVESDTTSRGSENMPDIEPNTEPDIENEESIPVPPDNPPAQEDTDEERDDYSGISYDDFIKENNRVGYLKILAYRGNQALPESGVRVRISKNIGDDDYIFFEGETDGSGIIDNIALPAPPRSTTLEYGLPDKTVIYLLEAEKSGFLPLGRSVEMFEGVKTIQPLRMMLSGGEE